MDSKNGFEHLNSGGLKLTRHAKERMCQRRISADAICAALDYGLVYRTRGAVIYALSRKGAEECRDDGRCGTKLDGLQVVCTENGSILTVYRNKDFRGLKTSLSRADRVLRAMPRRRVTLSNA